MRTGKWSLFLSFATYDSSIFRTFLGRGRGGTWEAELGSSGRAQVKSVLEKALRQYPRIGELTSREGQPTLVLRHWSDTQRNQILFHNQILQCGRVSLREVSHRRGLFNQGKREDVTPAGQAEPSTPPESSPLRSSQQAPPTPPTGRV